MCGNEEIFKKLKVIFVVCLFHGENDGRTVKNFLYILADVRSEPISDLGIIFSITTLLK